MSDNHPCTIIIAAFVAHRTIIMDNNWLQSIFLSSGLWSIDTVPTQLWWSADMRNIFYLTPMLPNSAEWTRNIPESSGQQPRCMPSMKSIEDYNLPLAFACPCPNLPSLFQIWWNITIATFYPIVMTSSWTGAIFGAYSFVAIVEETHIFHWRAHPSPTKLFIFKEGTTGLASLLPSNKRGNSLLANLHLVLIIGS